MSNPFSLLSAVALLQGRYRVKELIGKSGMGAVYEAKDERLGHSVALKQNFHGGDEKLKLAFEREARLLANLKHPCFVRVTDHFTAEQRSVPGDGISSGRRFDNTPLPARGFTVDKVLFCASNVYN